MKFDNVDWKIWPFKVWKKSFFELWFTILDDLDCHFTPFVENFCCIDFEYEILCIKELSFEFRKKISQEKNLIFILWKIVK